MGAEIREIGPWVSNRLQQYRRADFRDSPHCPACQRVGVTGSRDGDQITAGHAPTIVAQTTAKDARLTRQHSPRVYNAAVRIDFHNRTGATSTAKDRPHRPLLAAG